MTQFSDADDTRFVQRNEAGQIIGVYRRRQDGLAEEEVLASDPQVIAYLDAQNPPRAPDTAKLTDLLVEKLVISQQERSTLFQGGV